MDFVEMRTGMTGMQLMKMKLNKEKVEMAVCLEK